MYGFQQKKITRQKLKKKNIFKERASTRTRLKHGRDFGLLGQEFKIKIINMSRALMNKVEGILEQMGTEMEILRKKKRNTRGKKQ